jgi:hypothetical protein
MGSLTSFPGATFPRRSSSSAAAKRPRCSSRSAFRRRSTAPRCAPARAVPMRTSPTGSAASRAPSATIWQPRRPPRRRARSAVQRRGSRAADPREGPERDACPRIRQRAAGRRVFLMYAVRLWSVRHARGLNAFYRGFEALLTALRLAVSRRRLRAHRAPGRGGREGRQGPAVRLPHVRPMRAEFDRHVLPDELPEDSAQRSLRRSARQRPLRGQARDALRLGRGLPGQRTHPRRDRRDESKCSSPSISVSRAARRGCASCAKSARRFEPPNRRVRRHEVRGRAGSGLSAADPSRPHVAGAVRARAARRRLCRHDRARAAGFGRSRGRLQARARLRRLRRCDQRDRRQRRELPHVEPRGLLAADAHRVCADHADLLPRQESHRDPGRYPRRRRDGRLQHAVPDRRRRAGRRSSAGQAGLRPRLRVAARDRAHAAR